MSRTDAAARSAVSLTQNLLKNSEDLTATGWASSNATRTANAGTDPLGGATASLLTASASTGFHFANTTTTLLGGPPVSPGAIATLSAYLKAGTLSWGWLFGNNAGVGCYFNLSTGAVGTASGVTGAASSAGGGWWRCSITYAPAAISAGAAYVGFATASGNGTAIYTDGGTGTIFVWGAQFVGANWPGPYVKTTASAISTPIRSVAAARTAAATRTSA